MLVLWGQFSPQMFQKVMDLFEQDLQRHEQGLLNTDAIHKFASMGTKGTYPNNIWRDFKALLPKPKLPKPHDVLLPMVHNTLGIFSRKVPMILPHELFAAIYKHYPDMWLKIIYGGPERCRKFWNGVRNGPHFKQHPVRTRDGFETKCVPLKLHGDGTPVTGLGKGWSKMVDIFSLSSMLVYSCPIVHNLLIFLLFQGLQCVRDGHHTLNVFYRKLVWSFDILWEGKVPGLDWNNKPCNPNTAGDDLLGGSFMCIWALICDLDHGWKAYKMPNPNCNTPCGCCPCNASDTPWFDFRPTAAWIPKIYTVEDWLEAGLNACLLFGIIGVTILSWYPDWMHCKALGIDKILLGSVLWLLVHHILPGTVDENLEQLWEDIEQIYEYMGTQCRYGHMRRTMFTTKSAPKLQGRAAEIKDMGPVMVKLWEKYGNLNLDMHKKILVILKGSVHCDEILADHPSDYVLPNEAADDLTATAHIYLSTWYEVSQHCKDDDIPLFGITAKAHFLLHCCLSSRSCLSYKNR